MKIKFINGDTHTLIAFENILQNDNLVNCCKNRIAIITDDNVKNIYESDFEKYFVDHNIDFKIFSFPPGDKNKTRLIKKKLEDQMFESGFGRETTIVALGGGVVSDMAGFIAATYCRGVSLIIIPTTLLAMVDASIGGKNGVNTSRGKNLIGTVYQPQNIFIDTSFLKTLNDKEIKNGYVEMLKHALIYDANYFALLEKQINISQKTILRSCEIKKHFVEIDEHDNNQRKLLNFGHTIGHAIEKLSDYSISHGKVVAMGIIAESHISMQMGYLDKDSFLKIKNALNKCFPNLNMPFKVSEMLKIMKFDKKSLKNIPQIVVLKEIGKTIGCLPFDKYFSKLEKMI